MKKIIFLSLLSVVTLFSCEKKQTIEKKQELAVAEKPKMTSVAIEDVITFLTVENRDLLISELEKPHKNNDFVSIETKKKGEPISIMFETINGKDVYTGTQTTYDEHNVGKEETFTTLTKEQLKKLKETGSSGWKD